MSRHLLFPEVVGRISPFRNPVFAGLDLVKGGDNDPSKIPGGDCVRDAGGQVTALTYVDNVSTTGLISSIRRSQRGEE